MLTQCHKPCPLKCRAGKPPSGCGRRAREDGISGVVSCCREIAADSISGRLVVDGQICEEGQESKRAEEGEERRGGEKEKKEGERAKVRHRQGF